MSAEDKRSLLDASEWSSESASTRARIDDATSVPASHPEGLGDPTKPPSAYHAPCRAPGQSFIEIHEVHCSERILPKE